MIERHRGKIVNVLSCFDSGGATGQTAERGVFAAVTSGCSTTPKDFALPFPDAIRVHTERLVGRGSIGDQCIQRIKLSEGGSDPGGARYARQPPGPHIPRDGFMSEVRAVAHVAPLRLQFAAAMRMRGHSSAVRPFGSSFSYRMTSVRWRAAERSRPGCRGGGGPPPAPTREEPIRPSIEAS
jgi:hypothetical protein